MEPDIQNLGGIASPPDTRDFMGGSDSIPRPFSFLPDYSVLPVYNQLEGVGGKTACGGTSGTKLQNILLGFSGFLSWRAVFAWSVKIGGIPPEQGTFGRAIMQALQRYGVPRADLFPNDISLPIKDFADHTKIPQVAIEDALSRRIGAYRPVTGLTMEGLKQEIYTNKAVLVLKSPWTPASWFNGNSNCGHFFVLDGYDATRLRFANSFGASWHEKGEGWLEASDLATIKEGWVVYEPVIPPNPVPTPSNDPIPPIQPPTNLPPLERRNWLIRTLIALYKLLLNK